VVWGLWLGVFLAADEVRVSFAAGEAALLGGEFEGFFAVEFGLADELVHAVGEALGGVACGGLARERGADEESDFATCGAVFERCGEFGEGAAAEFFVDFGDFTGKAGGTVTEDFVGGGDGFRDAVRGFVEDKGAVFEAESFEGALAFTCAGGEKADEEEFIVRQPGGGERRQESGRARYGNDGDLVTRAESDEAIARVADERHASVANERDFGTLLHGNDEFRRASHFIVLVITDEGFLDFVMREQLLRVAGVFAGDLVSFFENAEGAERDVLEIADGSADEIEAADGVCGLGLHAVSLARRRVRELRGEFGTAAKQDGESYVVGGSIEERSLSTQANRFTGMNREEKALACFVRDDRGLCLRTVRSGGSSEPAGAELRMIYYEIQIILRGARVATVRIRVPEMPPAHRKNRIGIRATLEEVSALRRKGGTDDYCAGDSIQGRGMVCDGLRGEGRC
jgi:hypothetical protein